MSTAQSGEIKTDKKDFQTMRIWIYCRCPHDQNKFLTLPVKVDIPVTCYDFSELMEKDRMFTTAEVEEILKVKTSNIIYN